MTTIDDVHVALLVRLAGDVAGCGQGEVMSAALIGSRSSRQVDGLRLAVRAARAEDHEPEAIAGVLLCGAGKVRAIEHEIALLPAADRMWIEAMSVSVRALARDLLAKNQTRGPLVMSGTPIERATL